MPKKKNSNNPSPQDYDFCGYVTSNDVQCTDGRRIRRGAFAHQNGNFVPLVWQHQRNDPSNIIGKVFLEDREDGVYGYAKFNSSEKAQLSKIAVEHGDIDSMSIYANGLMEKSNNVMHGKIVEVSLVLAGANPGAKIQNVMLAHADGTDEELEGEAIIHSGELIEDCRIDDDESEDDDTSEDEAEHADNQNESQKSPTMRQVYESLTDDQKTLMAAVLEHILNSEDEYDEEDNDEDEDINHEDNGGTDMGKHRAFESQGTDEKSLEHAFTKDEQASILLSASKYGSLKDAYEEACLEHGITNIDYLFDEEKLIRQRPDLIDRDQAWVAKVYDAASKSPFSRIKSMAANLTADEARAKGYIKGKKKTDEQFSLLKRSTTPTTVYKKQSFDRDDIADINSFDIISWVKVEMRSKLREELARAMLVGDGRPSSSDDKINPQNIRPIYGDDDTYTIYKKLSIASNATHLDVADAIMDTMIMSRVEYKGSGEPTMFTTPELLARMVLARDKNGRRIYSNVAELATALRVKEIVEVPVFDGVTRTENSKKYRPLAIIVNMRDYTNGATKMGQVTMFEDFDIDYNKQK